MGNEIVQPVVSYDNIVKEVPFSWLEKKNSIFKTLYKGKNKIKKEQFIKIVLIPLFPKLNAIVLDRVYVLIDYDSSGVDSQKYVTFVYIVEKASKEDKMRFLFNLFDIKACGKLDLRNFLHMQKAIVKSFDSFEPSPVIENLVVLIAHTMFSSVPTGSLGNQISVKEEKTINFLQWCRYMEGNEILEILFASILKSDRADFPSLPEKMIPDSPFLSM